MANPEHRKHKVHPERFTVLAPLPPFIEVILQCNPISPKEFTRIAELALGYPNDPRMIEMVRKGGDASAKVPYLMEYGETAESILDTLREIALPHAENLKKLPEPIQATIHTLLSINMVPRGYEVYGIPALLEINRMQKEMTAALRGAMAGRKLAQEFHEENKAALLTLDREWHNVRMGEVPWPFVQSLPETPQMQYVPIIFRDILVAVREVCVIVDPPAEHELRALTPPVLLSPLPEHVKAPTTGSVDWLLRVVGKVGRHFTRALLDIIVRHLDANRFTPDPRDYDRINYQAQEALRLFNESHP